MTEIEDTIQVEFKDGKMTFNNTATFDSVPEALNLLNLLEKGRPVLALRIKGTLEQIEELKNQVKVLEEKNEVNETKIRKIREALESGGINVDEELDKLAIGRKEDEKKAEEVK